MFFPKILSFAILVATAAADLHASCYCKINSDFNAGLTESACSSYNAAGYEWGGTSYNSGLGLCAANPGADIAGDQWESACRTVGQAAGYAASTVHGVC